MVYIDRYTGRHPGAQREMLVQPNVHGIRSQ